MICRAAKAVETAGDVDTLLLDKTGTRTGMPDERFGYCWGKDDSVHCRNEMLWCGFSNWRADFPAECEKIVWDISIDGGTPLVVALNEQIIGVIELQDIIKPVSPIRLRLNMGWKAVKMHNWSWDLQFGNLLPQSWGTGQWYPRLFHPPGFIQGGKI